MCKNDNHIPARNVNCHIPWKMWHSIVTFRTKMWQLIVTFRGAKCDNWMSHFWRNVTIECRNFLRNVTIVISAGIWLSFFNIIYPFLFFGWMGHGISLMVLEPSDYFCSPKKIYPIFFQYSILHFFLCFSRNEIKNV